MKIIDDTLKKVDKDGNLRWSRTSLTMFTAWVLSIFMAVYSLVKYGFNYEVFLAFVAVSMGSKVMDSWSKRIHKEETITKE